MHRLCAVKSGKSVTEIVSIDGTNGEALWSFHPSGLYAAASGNTGDLKILTEPGIVYSVWDDKSGQHILIGVNVLTGKEIHRSLPVAGNFSDSVSGPFEFEGAMYVLFGKRLVRYKFLK